jgi:hypothetical protein
MNNWAKAIEFFNTHMRSNREQYFEYMNSKTKKLCTLDTYRLNLTAAGYLETVDRGMYIRKKKIPIGLPFKICLRIAKGEKIKDLDSICNKNSNNEAIRNSYKAMVEDEKRRDIRKKLLNAKYLAERRLEAI